MLPFSKIWWWVICIVAPPLAIYYSSRFTPEERPIFLIGNVLCYLIYLLPYALFGADVEMHEDEFTVRQYGTARLSYSDVRRSWCIFLVPFRIILVVTRQPFPRKILIVFDDEQGPRTAIYGGPLTEQWRERFKERAAAD